MPTKFETNYLVNKICCFGDLLSPMMSVASVHKLHYYLFLLFRVELTYGDRGAIRASRHTRARVGLTQATQGVCLNSVLLTSFECVFNYANAGHRGAAADAVDAI